MSYSTKTLLLFGSKGKQIAYFDDEKARLALIANCPVLSEKGLFIVPTQVNLLCFSSQRFIYAALMTSNMRFGPLFKFQHNINKCYNGWDIKVFERGAQKRL